ncbi:MAG: hypothetical protein ACFFG0_36355 [Candidatus Thorarchaeota archaeon]
MKKSADHLRPNAAIQQTHDKSYKTSQVLELKDFPFLESIIIEFFLL